MYILFMNTLYYMKKKLVESWNLDGIKIQWHRKMEITTIILPGF